MRQQSVVQICLLNKLSEHIVLLVAELTSKQAGGLLGTSMFPAG